MYIEIQDYYSVLKKNIVKSLGFKICKYGKFVYLKTTASNIAPKH